MRENYTVLHLHTMYGNGGFIDSTVKYSDYVDKAVELGMKSIAFTEHGSVFSWYKKKKYCEEKGLKYIHGIEAYVTESLDEKVRDNYHVCLYAKNFEGFKEINKLSSKSFNRKEENRYYYNPRITFDELINTSDNIIIATACLGGLLFKGNDDLKSRFLEFLIKNKHRCFLEVQHHTAKEQIEYNKFLYELHKKHQIPLTVGTDTHCLEESESRTILQRSKNIFFDEESGWDLTFKSYEQIVEAFKNQKSLDMDVILEALENTNKISDMVEEFELDYSNKYPFISENPEEIIKRRVEEGYKKRGLSKVDYQDRVEYELETYKKNGALQFILLEDMVKTYCRENNIRYGYARGSVSGSIVAYLLELTDINSVEWNLSFERFMSPERVSLADIDTDYSPSDRETIKRFLFEQSGLNCCEILTQNTIALKGAIRDVGRALEMQLDVVGEICNNIESDEEKYRKKYPELFKYVDKLNGTVVSVGSHPCGICCSDLNLEEMMATFTTSKDSNPVSQIDMKEIDAQNFTKLDILGLDTVELIQKTCELANIDWIETKNIDFEDKDVWDSIRKSSCMIFQWESSFAFQIYKKLFSEEVLSKVKEVSPKTTYIDLFSMGNGALRPAGESYRDKLCKGEFNDNGHPVLNEFMADTMGYLIYQEQVMEFLHEFCGFTKGYADIVRRGFAKKTGTEKFIPEIHDGFIKTMNEKYGEDTEKYEEVIVSFLKVIEDASSYLFSKNHSHPYSMIGFVCAWLRFHYPLEFITSALNIYEGKEEKTAEIVEYAEKEKVRILPIKFGKSKSEYFFDSQNKSIYKGIGSIKFLNGVVADEIYELSKNKYETFVDLILDIKSKTSTNSRQLDILTKLDFFSDFGNVRELLKIIELAEKFKFGEAKSIKKDKLLGDPLYEVVARYATDRNAKGVELKSFTITDCKGLLRECEEIVRLFKLEDIPIKIKIEIQQEYLGYISLVSGKEDDRPKLYVKEHYVINKRATGKPCGCNIICQSIGSGKQSKFVVWNKTLNKCGQIKKGDVINCLGYKKNGDDFELLEFSQII